MVDGAGRAGAPRLSPTPPAPPPPQTLAIIRSLDGPDSGPPKRDCEDEETFRLQEESKRPHQRDIRLGVRALFIDPDPNLLERTDHDRAVERFRLEWRATQIRANKVRSSTLERERREIRRDRTVAKGREVERERRPAGPDVEDAAPPGDLEGANREGDLDDPPGRPGPAAGRPRGGAARGG